MIKLINYKPRTFFFMSLGLIPIVFLIVWILVNIFGPKAMYFYVLLIFGSFIGFYLLWINTIYLSLDLVNVKKGFSSGRKRNRILFIILLSIYLSRMIVSLIFFEPIDSIIGMVMNILIGVFAVFFVTYLFYEVSEDYIFLTKNRTANLFDYFFMIFHLFFIPVGLMIFHSRVRLLLKENGIIEE